MKEEVPQLELWIQDIQSYVFKVISPTFKKAAFKFDRSDYTFSRKHGKNTQTFGFLFTNQFPIKYRVNFMLEISNKKIREAKSAFFETLKRDDFHLNGLVMFLKNFGESNGDENKKDYTIYGNKELFDAGDAINRILQYEAFPLCDHLTNLAALDSFYASRPGWSVTHYHIDNILSDLITARLNRERNLDEVYIDIADRIQRKDSKRRIDTDAGLLVTLCYEFLKKKY